MNTKLLSLVGLLILCGVLSTKVSNSQFKQVSQKQVTAIPYQNVQVGKPAVVVATPYQNVQVGKPVATPYQNVQVGKPVATPYQNVQVGKPPVVVATPYQNVQVGKPPVVIYPGVIKPGFPDQTPCPEPTVCPPPTPASTCCKQIANCQFAQVNADFTQYGCAFCKEGYQKFDGAVNVYDPGYCTKVSANYGQCKSSVNIGGNDECQVCNSESYLDLTNHLCNDLNIIAIDYCLAYFSTDPATTATQCAACDKNRYLDITTVTTGDETTCENISGGKTCGQRTDGCDACATYAGVDYCLTCSSGYIGVVSNPVAILAGNYLYDECLSCSAWRAKFEIPGL